MIYQPKSEARRSKYHLNTEVKVFGEVGKITVTLLKEEFFQYVGEGDGEEYILLL